MPKKYIYCISSRKRGEKHKSAQNRKQYNKQKKYDTINGEKSTIFYEIVCYVYMKKSLLIGNIELVFFNIHIFMISNDIQFDSEQHE